MPAIVPEHSRLLLEALSGGSTFEVDSHVFSADDDWLMAIGYPQEGEFSTERLEAAIRKAVAQTGASECFVIAPELQADTAFLAQELQSALNSALASARSTMQDKMRAIGGNLGIDIPSF